MLFGDLVIAHSLIASLGERRVNAILAMLENPELLLADSDRYAFERFLDRLADHYGPDMPALRQLSVLRRSVADCPE